VRTLKKEKKTKRRKGSSGSKSFTPIWIKQNYIPNKKNVRELHQEDYRKRFVLPEGKGTNRSFGSNKRLKKMVGF
jgi:hypothetical protein